MLHSRDVLRPAKSLPLTSASSVKARPDYIYKRISGEVIYLTTMLFLDMGHHPRSSL
jgi:hypothetical protein